MEAGGPLLRARYPTHPTQDTPAVSPGFAYGAVTLYGPPFQAVRLHRERLRVGVSYNPTSRVGCPTRFSLGCAGFGRPYSRHPVLVSFPPPTEMFHFGGFPPLSGRLGLLGPGRRSHSGIPGSTAACASPGLIAACHALLRRPEPSHPPPAVLPGRFCPGVAPCPAPFHG